MKNIILLPTEKASRLYLYDEILKLGDLVIVTIKYTGAVNQHIYITNDEEIKEGEYGLSKLNEIIKFHSGYDYRYYAKIILTTDQDLIKDSVQAINDEFLEWFVKNPSCEEVEVEIETTSIQLPQQQLSENSYDLAFRWINKKVYKIIIPKEESKQLFTKGDKVLFSGKMLDEEVIDKVVTVFYTLGRGKVEDMSDIMDEYSHIYRVWNKDLKHIPKQKPKQEIPILNGSYGCTIQIKTQETLEEVAKKLFGSLEKGIGADRRSIWMNGAKWQQERMYSEEEVTQLLIKFNQEIQEVEDVRGWFEQFKKK